MAQASAASGKRLQTCMDVTPTNTSLQQRLRMYKEVKLDGNSPSRPGCSKSCKTKLQEKLAFAVHAVVAVNGARLLAVGDAADFAAAPPSLDSSASDEASIDGWNQGACYSFLYALDDIGKGGGAPRMLLKCLPLDTGSLLVSLLCDSMQHEQQPSSFELQSQDYAGTDAASTTSYSNLERLVDQVQAAYNSQVQAAREQGSKTAGTASGAQHTAAPAKEGSSTGQRPARQPVQSEPDPDAFDPLRDYSQPSYDRTRAGPRPLRVGEGDRFPAGVPGFGVSGPDMGGGMLMGPGHPAFAGRRGAGPLGGPGMGGPGPGMRWDPINPEGLPGFRPGDFFRPRQGVPGQMPPIHPDIMQPGPGRGTDFDDLYG